jgi:hypothetical protein
MPRLPLGCPLRKDRSPRANIQPSSTRAQGHECISNLHGLVVTAMALAIELAGVRI